MSRSNLTKDSIPFSSGHAQPLLHLPLQYRSKHRHLNHLLHLLHLLHLYPSKLHRLLPSSSITLKHLLHLYPHNQLSNSTTFHNLPSNQCLQQLLLPTLVLLTPTQKMSVLNVYSSISLITKLEMIYLIPKSLLGV